MIDLLSSNENLLIFINIMFYFASSFIVYRLGVNTGMKLSKILPAYENISLKSFLALKHLNGIDDEWDTIANMTKKFGESTVRFLLVNGYIGLVMKVETPCVKLTVEGKSILSSVKFAKLP